MAEISLTNTINVSLSQTPQGLSEYVIANTALFSNETAGFSDEYRVYVNPSDVATDFGSSSLTYEMATAMFAQSPNLRTGRGSLYVVPYVATNATSGHATTASLTANIDNFKAIEDGALKITLDGGTATQLTNLNFTGITTLQNIADVILAKLPDVFIEVSGATLVFTSKRFGTASTVAFSTSSTGTDIYGSNYLNLSGITPVAGTNAVDTETLTEAINRVSSKIYFGAVLDTCYRENTSITTIATNVQAMDCLFFTSTASHNNIEVLGTAIKTAGDTKTRLLAYSLSQIGAKQAIAAYASIAVSPNFNANQTAITMNLKELSTIDPDTNLSQTIFTKAQTNGVDLYGSTGGLSVVYSNDNGMFTDDAVNQLWLKKQFEVAGFNYLKTTGTKIPQTEAGMTGLKNAYAQVCEKAVRNGILGTGLTWNSALTFGDPEDFARNITEKGYYIYSLPIAEQSQADREDRIAPVCQVAMKFAGAIHFSDLIGVIER